MNAAALSLRALFRLPLRQDAVTGCDETGERLTNLDQGTRIVANRSTS
ncbi:hypothetical protein [Azospirillum rugosum]|uniref:Uncharacterized protein n=1 Tax=Azospirillum rugosum TaxID=416170 RepID=A0ABS4SMP2_9PROT|nr:hypothetical protein [Azospirillum rugosum]MBP2293348.1 hypothetical protein [Azospirillum rugosum]